MFTANYSQTSQSSVGEDTFQKSYSEHQRPIPEWMELASYPCRNQDGTVVQLWRWKVKEVVIAVVDKPTGERYYLPSTHICNGLNPAEKGGALIDRLSSTLKTDRWKLIYYREHVHIWPVMRAAGSDEVVYSYAGIKMDPHSIHRPADCVDMEQFKTGKSRTSLGYVRDNKKFWQEWLKMEAGRAVKTLSQDNIEKIKNGDAPLVDEVWIKAYPEHADYLNASPKERTLVHHHFDNGRYAVPLPDKAHRTYSKVYHPHSAETLKGMKEMKDAWKKGEVPRWVFWSPSVKGKHLARYQARLRAQWLKQQQGGNSGSGGSGNKHAPKHRNAYSSMSRMYPNTMRMRYVASLQVAHTRLRYQSFSEKVQQNGLVRTFNGANAGKPIPTAGRLGGSIGGVGNQVGVIIGMEDDPIILMEAAHSFYIPTIDGKIPFSNQQLNQILRELARGIYVYGKAPCFSLHFNGNTDMYPVMDPAYTDTWVGRIIGLIDYYMKGFLNGGFFDEAFILKWLNMGPEQRKNKETLRNNIIDVHAYVQEHLGAHESYQSIREMIDAMKSKDIAAENPEEPEDEIFNDYTGFRSSFRIIAKQNEIRKSDQLFSIDGDFDVRYTIEPDPSYAEALERYRQTYSKEPLGYRRLEKAYEKMALQIRHIMPRLPMFRELFNQLNIINFFCYYFNTLKRMNKVPVLSHQPETPVTTASLFPSLPIRKMQKVNISFQWEDVLKVLSEGHKEALKVFIAKAPESNPSAPKDLVNALAKHVRDLVVKSALSMVSEAHRRPEFYCSVVQELFNIFQGKPEAVRAKIRKETEQLFHDTRLKIIGNFINELVQAKNDPSRQQSINQLNAAKAQNNQEVQKGNQVLTQYNQQLAHVKQAQKDLNTSRAKNAYKPWYSAAEYQIEADKLNKYERDLKKAIQEVSGQVQKIQQSLQKINSQISQLQNLPAVFDRCIAHAKSKLQQASQGVEALGTFIPANKSGIEAPLLNGLKQFDAKMQQQLSEKAKALQKVNSISNLEFLKDMGCDFPMVSQVIQLYQEEEDNHQAQENKRIVGGCGVSIGAQSLRLAPEGAQILDSVFGALPKEVNEAFTPVSQVGGKPSGYVFQVKVADFAAAENIEHMNWLIPSKEDEVTTEDLAQKDEVLEAILVDDLEGFEESLKQPGLDLSNPDTLPLLQYAAMSENPYYIRRFLKLNVPFKQKDANGATLMHYAAKKGRTEAIKALHSAASELINQADRDGATPLHMAVQKNREPSVRVLLDLKANPNIQTSYGMTPLYSALHHGHRTIAMKLLELPNIHFGQGIEDGTTPLHLAVEAGFLEVVTRLVQRGAQLGTTRIDGYSALHLTAMYGDEALCNFVFSQSGIDLNQPLKSGKTPLHLAAQHNEVYVVELLLGKGADIGKVGWDNQTALVTALKCGNTDNALALIDHANATGQGNFQQVKFIDRADVNGDSPRLVAMEMGNMEVFEELVECGMQQPEPKQFLMDLCRYGYNLDYILSFIDLHKFDDATINEAYLTAARYGQNHIVTHYYYEEKKGYAVTDANQRSILHYAAMNDYFEPLQDALKANKVDLLTAKDVTGVSPIGYAAQQGSIRTLKKLMPELVRKKVNMDAQWKGHHVLAAAIENGHIEAADIIIHAILFPKIPLSPDMSTAGHIAARKGDVEMLRLLKSRGVNFHARDNQGHTSFHKAVDYNNKDALYYLLDPSLMIGIPDDLLEYIVAKANGEVIDKVFEFHHEAAEAALSTGKPVFGAIEKDNIQALDALYRHGTSLVKPNSAGLTPLMVAAKEGKIKCLQYLIKHGVSLSSVNPEGQNALHLAVLGGQEEAVTLLVSYGMSPNVKDGCNKTPYLIAREKDYKDIIMILEGKIDAFEALKMQAMQAVEAGSTALFLKYAKQLPHNRSMAFEINGQRFHRTLAQISWLRDSSPQKAIFTSLKQTFPESVEARSRDGITMSHVLVGSKTVKGDINIEWLEADNDGYTPLHTLSARGDLQALQAGISTCQSVDPKDGNGNTPLMYAIETGYIESVSALVKAGANINHTNFSGATPLSIAIGKGNVRIVKQLLSSGADPDKICDAEKNTPLHRAVEVGSIEIVEWLLRYDAKHSQESIDGVTPMLLAAKLGHLNIIKLLIGAGDSLAKQDRYGQTIAHYAMKSGDSRLIGFLYNEGINFDYGTEPDEVELRYSQRALSEGTRPIHIAAREGHMNAVEFLRLHGVAMQVEDKNKFSPLFKAAMGYNTKLLESLKPEKLEAQTIMERAKPIEGALIGDNVKALQVLLEGVPSVNDYIRNDGKKVIHLAAMYGAKKCTEYLISIGADPGDTDFEKNTILHLAASFNRIDYVHYLLENGYVDIDAQTNRKETALFLATENDYPEIALLLLAYNADPEIKNKGDITAFFVANMRHHEAIARMIELCNGVIKDPIAYAVRANDVRMLSLALRRYPQAINDLNFDGLAPLHVAVLENNIPAIRKLIQEEADLEIKDSNGCTPLFLAISKGCSKYTVELLLSAGANLDVRNKAGETALHALFNYGSYDYIVELAEYSSDAEGHYGQVKQFFDKTFLEYLHVSPDSKAQGAHLATNSAIAKVNALISGMAFQALPCMPETQCIQGNVYLGMYYALMALKLDTEHELGRNYLNKYITNNFKNKFGLYGWDPGSIKYIEGIQAFAQTFVVACAYTHGCSGVGEISVSEDEANASSTLGKALKAWTWIVNNAVLLKDAKVKRELLGVSLFNIHDIHKKLVSANNDLSSQTTQLMNKIFLEIPDILEGWKTNNAIFANSVYTYMHAKEVEDNAA